jgi:uncharacterized protein (DUF58 family)
MPREQKPRARPRLRSRLVPALVLVLLALQLLVPYRAWFIVLVALSGMWLMGYVWARALARGLRLRREIWGGWAQVGDLLQERFHLENTSLLPALWLEVIDHSSLPGYNPSWAIGIGGGAETSWQTRTVCQRRGIATLGPTTLRSGDPFGLYTFTIEYPAMNTITVMPPIVPLPPIEVAPGGRSGEGRPRPYTFERTVSTSGVREYVPGDSYRWIHWPTSVRHDKLYVRHFEGAPVGDWWIFLDLEQRVQVGSGQDSTEEHAIILAASLTDQGLRAGRSVGLAAQSEGLVWLPPQQGDGQRQRIMRTLALISPGAQPLATLLDRARFAQAQHTSVIIVTPSLEASWITTLLLLLRRGIKPTVLLLDPTSFGGGGSIRPARDLLASAGIVHYVITRELIEGSEAHHATGEGAEWRTLATGRVISLRNPQGQKWRELV